MELSVERLLWVWLLLGSVGGLIHILSVRPLDGPVLYRITTAVMVVIFALLLAPWVFLVAVYNNVVVCGSEE